MIQPLLSLTSYHFYSTIDDSGTFLSGSTGDLPRRPEKPKGPDVFDLWSMPTKARLDLKFLTLLGGLQGAEA